MARLLALCGVAAAGPLAMGADPPPGPPMPVPPVSRAERLARVLPTPRLFEITMTVDGRSRGPTQYCMSAETAARQAEAVRARAPARTTPPGQGCTHRTERGPGGGMHMETVCDKAAGAAATYRGTADQAPGMRDFHHHMESQTGDPPRTIVSDARIVQLGDCPADLKPGQMRGPDGRVRDMAALNPSP
jgi:hypothetical protein